MAEAGYRLDSGELVLFEVDGTGYRPAAAGADHEAGKLADAARSALAGAEVVVRQLQQAAPDELTVRFGIKVNGGLNWVVARAATEAHFEVEMKWEPQRSEVTHGTVKPGSGQSGTPEV